jgi:hypothetical protein
MIHMHSPNLSPSRHSFVVPLILYVFMCGSYFLCQVIALSHYPDYSITKDYISSGGSPYGNPDGWQVWMVGHVLYGIFMGILVWFISRRMHSLQPEGLRGPKSVFQIGRLFLYISVIGWVLMGLVPNWHGDGWKVMHGVNAALLLGGYHLGIIQWSIILLHTRNVSKNFSRIVMGLTLAAPIGFIASQTFNLLSGIGLEGAIDGSGAWYLTIPFWEWMVMFGISGAFVVMGLGLKVNPGNIPRAIS